MPDPYSIFWIEIDKIKPNPFQPRRAFDEDKLRALADSIRQYGVLQPLVVTRQEEVRPEGGLGVSYELIAGERRLRAAQLAGLFQVPAVIRDNMESERLKLEMAIIENLQREDLNPVERARAFHQLVAEFGLKHQEIAKRIGKSREFVSNSIRIIALPEEMIQALVEGKINEGHTRPLLMLVDRPEEQKTLFQEILVRKINVREAEGWARRIALERVRKRELLVEPEIIALEQQLTDRLGTRVRVERRQVGGKVTIDFFSNDDLHKILEVLNSAGQPPPGSVVEQTILETAVNALPAEDESLPAEDDSELYNIKDFSL